MSQRKNIEEVDSNFKIQPNVEGDMIWIDAFDERLAVRGLGWPCENRAARNFRRIPLRAEEAMSEGVKILLHQPASVFLSFRTNSRKIAVRMKNESANRMVHMPLTGSNGGELYLKDDGRWMAVATAIPLGDSAEFERELLTGLSGSVKEYRLYLPLYMRLVAAEIGVEDGATVEPVYPPEGAKPIVFYGTSITQGGCASTAGGDYVSILGRELDAEVINLGFSGSGKGEPAVATLIREIDAEMFVLDYHANVNPELADKTLPVFVELLREVHPKTPIVLMSKIRYNHHYWNTERFQNDERGRDIFMEHYLRFRKEGDKNIHFIDGFGLLGPGMSGDYVDGVHPTSAGFVQMAQRLLPQLRLIRAISRDERFTA